MEPMKFTYKSQGLRPPGLPLVTAPTKHISAARRRSQVANANPLIPVTFASTQFHRAQRQLLGR